MAEELDDYLQNYNYKVTINTKRPAQLVTDRVRYNSNENVTKWENYYV